jgi:hypothetical protein
VLEDESTQRLANRLADLRLLGDRNRPFHPVSVLRNDIVSGPASEPETGVGGVEPTLEDRAEALARRILSPVLARAEQLADMIRGEPYRMQ